jgi:hypothetical protein
MYYDLNMTVKIKNIQFANHALPGFCNYVIMNRLNQNRICNLDLKLMYLFLHSNHPFTRLCLN